MDLEPDRQMVKSANTSCQKLEKIIKESPSSEEVQRQIQELSKQCGLDDLSKLESKAQALEKAREKAQQEVNLAMQAIETHKREVRIDIELNNLAMALENGPPVAAGMAPILEFPCATGNERYWRDGQVYRFSYPSSNKPGA